MLIFNTSGVCEGGKTYQLPRSQDTICFLNKDKGELPWDEGKEECQKGGYGGHLEFRYEEDTIFMAKLLYCGLEYIQRQQPGMCMTTLIMYTTTLI